MPVTIEKFGVLAMSSCGLPPQGVAEQLAIVVPWTAVIMDYAYLGRVLCGEFS